MARLPRYNLPGQPQHVILRGNNRNIIFAAEEDYHFFIECLQRAVEEHGCAIHAYVLMTNHVHLLMTPAREDSISKTMQSLGRRYVQYLISRRSAPEPYGKGVTRRP
jgi:putative transposase